MGITVTNNENEKRYQATVEGHLVKIDYITTKNKKNTPDRLELKKFNPILKKMTVHKEIK